MPREAQGRGPRPTGIGCIALVVIALGCALATTLSIQFVLPRVLQALVPISPVITTGDCPQAEVQAFIEDQGIRLGILLGPLQAVTESDAPLREAVQDLDLEAIDAARDRLAQTEVPACAASMLEAELAMAEDIYDLLASFEDCPATAGDGSEVEACFTRELAAAIVKLPLHGKRLSEGYEALAEKAGIPDSSEP